MTVPAASVILPTYNRCRTLERAIGSVLNQSFHDLELVIVDDGSTDATPQVVAGVEDSRVTYLQLRENAGVGRARNVGAQTSRAPFLAFIDSDDEWLEDKLRIQMEVFRQWPEVGVVYCDMLRTGRDGSESYHHAPHMVQGRLTSQETRYFQPYGIGAQSVVIRRSLFEEVGGFDEAFRCFEDLDLFLRLSRVCLFHHIASALVRYRYSEDGLTQMPGLRLAGQRRLLRLYWKDIARENPGFLVRETFRLGRRSMSQSLGLPGHRSGV